MEKYWVQNKLEKLFNRVKYHEDVFDEIMELVVTPGIGLQFVKLLEKNLDMIDKLGTNVIQTNAFEKLKKAGGLYSMKFKSKSMNLRILYSYDNTTSTILLHCFYEKEDSGKCRYDDHIPIALLRKHEMEEKNG